MVAGVAVGRTRSRGRDCATAGAARYAGHVSGRGGGVNKALHLAAGGGGSSDTLEALTRREFAPSGRPGEAYAVALPEGNPLRASDGVEWILHAVGPNMNADKPLCLKGDYAQGTLLLGETYRAVFDRFHALLTGTPSSSQ